MWFNVNVDAVPTNTVKRGRIRHRSAGTTCPCRHQGDGHGVQLDLAKEDFRSNGPNVTLPAKCLRVAGVRHEPGGYDPYRIHGRATRADQRVTQSGSRTR